MPKAKTKNKYPELHEIREDLDSLKHNVVALTKHVQKDGIDQVEEVSEKAQKSLNKLQMLGLSEMKKAEKHVKEKPGQSLAMAFAGGILASMLLRRRR